MISIAFLVSGNGGTLKFLFKSIELLNLSSNLEIVAVVADRSCGALDFAKANNIKNFKISYNKNNRSSIIDVLNTIHCDIVITNIHKIIDPKTLKTLDTDFINLHYSLLPAFSGLIGMQTVTQAKQKNVQFIGSTCHEVIEEVDQGKIIAQSVFPVNWENSISDINQQVFRDSCYTILNGVLLKAKYQPVKKNDNTRDSSIYSPLLLFDTTLFDVTFWNDLKKA